jgi:DNA-binding NarL/FixJ family response regulator
MNTLQGTIKFLIVDDHPAVREGLALRISRQPGWEVCGEASDIDDAMELLAASRPDLVVIDISLKSSNGIELIKRIKATGSSARMLVWSMHDEALYAARALRAGAMGYINKGQATDKIVAAICCVLDNRVYLDPAVTESSASGDALEHTVSATSALETLSDRELEVFSSIGQG